MGEKSNEVRDPAEEKRVDVTGEAKDSPPIQQTTREVTETKDSEPVERTTETTETTETTVTDTPDS